MKRDRFERIDQTFTHADPEPKQKPDFLLVAALLDDNPHDNTGTSFHFAVRDQTGQWSHKHQWSMVESQRLGETSGPLRSPHIYPQDYLGNRYRFVAYFWRPVEGIDVTGGQQPSLYFSKSGDLYTGQTYQSDKVLDHIRVGTRGDYLLLEFHVETIQVHVNDGAKITLTITGRKDHVPVERTISLPKILIFKGRVEILSDNLSDHFIDVRRSSQINY